MLLAGCSAGNYPSLARWPQPASTPATTAQPVTSGQIAAPPAPAQIQAHIGPGCDGAQADAINAEFDQALPGAESALRDVSHTEPGSKSWSAGNIALARLQQIRARLGQVLAPAEETYVADTLTNAQDDARDGAPMREDGKTLAACRAHIDAMATHEDQQIDRLHARLPD